ncbi:MAG: pyridoxamine kinase, partial [Kiritimatiellae bacterium]|nr:pyridoxamine kinase [Kiritimatiellia bacterium]
SGPWWAQALNVTAESAIIVAMDHNRQKKAAVINDYSSFGRCSLGAAVPILSAMRVQCCPVPTAIFTNHTGFSHFSYVDMSDRLDAYIDDWKATGLSFSAIASGYLASVRQIDFVRRFVEVFRAPETVVMVDPVMGDYGKLYPSFKMEVAEGLRSLLTVADYLTPNLTEACILANRPYCDRPTPDVLREIAAVLCEPHARGVVISGIPHQDALINYVYTRDGEGVEVSVGKIGPDRSGTGDVFMAVVLGALVNGDSLENAVGRAVSFVAHSVAQAENMGIPTTDGLPFEEVLSELWS